MSKLFNKGNLLGGVRGTATYLLLDVLSCPLVMQLKRSQGQHLACFETEASLGFVQSPSTQCKVNYKTVFT